ncbi:MAG: PilZ domain-containing protein [Candidatus Methylomirabilales bacterium]
MLARNHDRFSLRMPVLCESPAFPRDYALGVTQNVSRKGLLLELQQPPAPYTPLSLVLVVGEEAARAEALVVWVAEGSPGRMGLRLVKVSDNDSLIWERLVAFQAGPTARASLRIPVALEVTCLVPHDGRLRGWAANLSEGGLMVTLPQVLPPRTHLTVTVPPGLTFPRVGAALEVMWNRTVPEGRGVIHGLRFLADDIGKELFLIGALLQQLFD